MIEIVARRVMKPGMVLMVSIDHRGRWRPTCKGERATGMMMHPDTAAQLRAALPPVEDVARAMGGEP